MKIMGVEEVRFIVRWLDPAYLARLVWRAAGDEGYAVGALGLASRRLMTISWPQAEKPPPIDEPVLVLLVCEPGQHTRTRWRLSAGATLPPSEEVVETEIVEEVRENEEYYKRIEEQLRKIYGESRAA